MDLIAFLLVVIMMVMTVSVDESSKPFTIISKYRNLGHWLEYNNDVAFMKSSFINWILTLLLKSFKTHRGRKKNSCNISKYLFLWPPRESTRLPTILCYHYESMFVFRFKLSNCFLLGDSTFTDDQFLLHKTAQIWPSKILRYAFYSVLYTALSVSIRFGRANPF